MNHYLSMHIEFVFATLIYKSARIYLSLNLVDPFLDSDLLLYHIIVKKYHEVAFM